MSQSRAAATGGRQASLSGRRSELPSPFEEMNDFIADYTLDER